jgi:hypothetical protein
LSDRRRKTSDELVGIYFWKTTTSLCCNTLQMGLFDFLAPRKNKSERKSEGSFFKEEGTISSASDDLRGDYVSQSVQLDGLPLDPPEVDPRVYQTQKERQKQSQLQEQRARELNAATRGFFVKNQRVKYYHQANQRWIEDATVAGVHLDDGPDKPYYVRNCP